MEKTDRTSLTQSRLKELVGYSSETGAFHWLVTRRGSSAKVGDRADARIAADGQRYITIDGVIQSASRLAWLYVNGAWPATRLMHRDDNSAGNAIDNLYEPDTEKRPLTHERLLDMLHYDPETGVFTWRRRIANVAVGSVAGRVWANNGYRYIGLDGEDYTAQQLAWFWMKGEPAKGPVRFQDRDPTNLRFGNLSPGRWLDTAHDHSTPEGRSAYGKAHRAAHPDHYKNSDLQKRFDMTLEQYAAKLVEQKGVCAICAQPETAVHGGKLKQLAVDHDHETNAVRDLLCQACNLLVGFAGDNSARLRAAADYLDRHAVSRAPNVIPIRSA